MNALFYSIANDKAETERFLQLANETFSLQNDYKVYMEPSFSNYFGDPDAVIVDSENVFFIEAKVCAQNKWELETKTKVIDNYNNDKSGLFGQIHRKLLLVEALKTQEVSDLKIKNPITDENCKLGKHPFVTSLSKEIKGKRPHYIAIIPAKEQEQSISFDFLINAPSNYISAEIFFIPWKQIEEKFSHSYQLLFDAFEHNKGQIYNE